MKGRRRPGRPRRTRILITTPKRSFSMSDRVPFSLRRGLLYIGAATLLAIVVGVFQQGSLGGGLVLGLAVGVGVAIGLAVFEIASQYLDG